MRIRRVMGIMLCLALLLASAGGAMGEEMTGRRWLRLGQSSLKVMIDERFVEGEVTEEDRADDQVSYLCSDGTTLDFDVYEFTKEGLPQALADYAAEEASACPAVSELRTDAAINGIPVAWYRTVEQFAEGEYETVTYIVDAGEAYVELVFWLDGEGARTEATRIMETLSPVEMKAIPLGRSPFSVYALAEYEQGGVSEADREDDQVAYWFSTESLLDFDVYEFSKQGLPQDLADYASEEAGACASVSGIVTDGAINGIPAAWYRTVEEYDEAEYDTLTYILDSGDAYVEVVFWLDDATDAAQAQAIIGSLTESGD